MKKEAFILVLAMLLVFPISYSLNLGTAKGYIINTTGLVMTGSNITITVSGCSGGGCSVTTASDANGFYIKSNLNIVPGNTVIVNATKGDASGGNTGIATGSGSAGVAVINVTMCSPPQMPLLSAVPDSHNTSVTLSWTTFQIGGEFDEFQFDSAAIVSPATSPQLKTGLNYTTHTWRARTCNSFCCSNFSVDSFETINQAPPAPTLSDQGHTQATPLSFIWTNFSDPDGDTTHNEFQISTDSGFGTIIDSDTNADSPKIFSNTTTFSLYFWRVRTCDNIGLCSVYNNDSFFLYFCPSSTTTQPGGTKTVYKNVTESCVPSWDCKDWGSCSSSGVSIRSCFDINNCIDTVPKEYQYCNAAIVETPRPTETGGGYLHLGNQFILKQLEDEIIRGGYILYTLLLVIIGLCFALIHQHQRYVVMEIKTEGKLKEYISAALNKGFTQAQIKPKLLDSGFAEEEIDYVFKNMKTK